MDKAEKEISRRTLSHERRMRAFELRKSGASYSKIGTELGISMQAAHQHVKKVLLELAKKTNEDAKDVLRMELDRLDQMLSGLYDVAIAGDVSAVDRVIKIMDRRAKLLGLDAPTKQEVTGKDGGVLGGVIAIPVVNNMDDWEKMVLQQQQKLKNSVKD